MNRFSLLVTSLLLCTGILAQSPQKMSYQAIVRNAAGKLVQSANVSIRITILQGSATGTPVYTETHNTATNINGLVSIEIGSLTGTGSFADINWAEGPFFLQTETDPSGGSNYNITGISQLLSVPYALYSEKAGNGFSGDYNDLINKPITDGSETKVQAGMKITVTGNGTIATPYVINTPENTRPPDNKIVLTASQVWSVPANVSKIKVELWGAAGGGGGAGVYSYSYNYSLNYGGNGGCGGYAEQEMNVVPDQQFPVVIGSGGNAGTNAISNFWGQWYGDTNGGDGEDTWFSSLKAASGMGGKKGSYSLFPVPGFAGTDNIGSITAYPDPSDTPILNVFQGLPRSYIYDRVLTSKPGKGGSVVTGYSFLPGSGEPGCVVITFWE